MKLILQIVVFTQTLYGVHAFATKSTEGVLTPQLLVTRALYSSTTGKEILLQKPMAEAELMRAASFLDWQVFGQYSSSHNQGESPGSFSIDEENTTMFSLGTKKTFQTGTSLSVNMSMLDYEVAYPESLPFPGAHNQANQLELELRQELWQNQFGAAQRAQLSAIQASTKHRDLQIRSSQASFAQGILRLYWQAVALDGTQRELRLAVQRMDNLLSYTTDRSKFGLIELGEVERIKADKELQRQQLATASSQLRQIVTRVAVLLDIPVPRSTNGILPESFQLGTRPIVENLDIRQSRAWRLTASQKMANDLQVEAAESQAAPQLALFFKSSLNGVDSDSQIAWDELQNGDRPNLSFGVSFSHSLDNQLAKAGVISAKVAAKKAEFDQERLEDEWTIKNETLLLAAQTAWDQANSSQNIRKLRQQATKQLTKGFKQGRVGLDQVIMASNLMTQSQLTYLNDLTRYFIAKDELLSHRERLLDEYVDPSLGGRQ